MDNINQVKHEAQRAFMLRSLENKDLIPEDERFVLQKQSSYPLERGGIYSEMGADMTYEELRFQPNTLGELTYYEQQPQQSIISFTEVVGILFMLIGTFLIFYSPIWFSTITFGIMLIARKHKLKVVMTIALLLTVFGLIIVLYQLV